MATLNTVNARITKLEDLRPDMVERRDALAAAKEWENKYNEQGLQLQAGQARNQPHQNFPLMPMATKNYGLPSVTKAQTDYEKAEKDLATLEEDIANLIFARDVLWFHKLLPNL